MFGWTKTCAIVNYIGGDFFDQLVTDIHEMSFSNILDVSNDVKMFPIPVKTLGVKFSRVITTFFYMMITYILMILQGIIVLGLVLTIRKSASGLPVSYCL